MCYTTIYYIVVILKKRTEEEVDLLRFIIVDFQTREL